MRFCERSVVVLLVCGTLLSLSWADEVYRRGSSTPLRGEIASEDKESVAIKRTGTSGVTKVPLIDVMRIQYSDTVGLAIRQAELVEKGGEYEKAAKAYEEAAGRASTPLIKKAAQFGHARALARVALTDPSRADAAIRALEGFGTMNPNSRFHYELQELLGDLHSSKGDTAAAQAAYSELEQAPWPAYQLKAKVYEGRLLVAQKQHPQAVAQFDAVIREAGENPDEQLRRAEAMVGKAEALIALQQAGDALQLVRDVIGATDKETARALQATAFNLLGDAQRAAGKTDQAILAYLYVDLLLPQVQTEHAKALYYLQALWEQLGNQGRAAEHREKLQANYPNSAWARRIAQP